MRLLRGILCTCAAALGCASFDEQVAPARQAYYEGRYARAVELLEPFIEEPLAQMRAEKTRSAGYQCTLTVVHESSTPGR